MAAVEPGADRVVIYHWVTEGECHVEPDSGPPVHLVTGDVVVLAKLAEVLIIEVLRLYMSENSERRPGGLAALSDRIVGAALKALHDRPAQAWTLQELARAAGTSRSVLAERFQRMVGSSPIQYLTQWRMTLAADLLRCRSNVPLAQVAEQVGYQTDTAFSRAFRRRFGAPPSAWRRSQARRGAADAVS
jgi:AraC-like DNA-binding protein